MLGRGEQRETGKRRGILSVESTWVVCDSGTEWTTGSEQPSPVPAVPALAALAALAKILAICATLTFDPLCKLCKHNGLNEPEPEPGRKRREQSPLGRPTSTQLTSLDISQSAAMLIVIIPNHLRGRHEVRQVSTSLQLVCSTSRAS